ncbi:twin-arginine translocation signal domain-containing protein [Arthrobacter sp. NPDC097144]
MAGRRAFLGACGAAGASVAVIVLLRTVPGDAERE